MSRRFLLLVAAVAVVLPALAMSIASAGRASEKSLVIYCGRSESLVGPLIERFRAESGINVEPRFDDSTNLANLLIEESARSPADVFFSQDPGALGAVAAAGLLAPVPSESLDRVATTFRSPKGEWVGVSGRARVIAWSTARLKEADLPRGMDALIEPEWKGRIGWAPSNASFQLFITAMRHTRGDDATRAWLMAMQDNGVRDFPSNRPVIQAIADGEIDLGLVNHYYLLGFQREKGLDFPVANLFLPGDIGGLMSVAGVGVLASTPHRAEADRFVEFLLSDESQRYFAEKTGEYPLAGPGARGSTEPDPFATAGVDLGSLADLRQTLDLLRECGVLP